MQPNYKNLFLELSSESRVWIYQNQKAISKTEQIEIQSNLNIFIKEWAAHGNQLFGAATILEDYFIVIAVDESKTMALGCSIDSSVRFLKILEKEHQLDLFNRLNVLIEEKGEKKTIHFSELSQHKGAIFFNPMITNLGDFRENWKKKIE